MSVLLRLKRLAIALAIVATAVVASGIAIYAAYIASAIAFSGSTGFAHKAFFDRLAPFISFTEGAIAVGGFVAIFNAIFVSAGIWSRSIAASALVGGLFSALNPVVTRSLQSHFLPALGLVSRAMLNK